MNFLNFWHFCMQWTLTLANWMSIQLESKKFNVAWPTNFFAWQFKSSGIEPKTRFKFFQVISSSHNDWTNNRQNLDFCCRSTLKATNLSLTVVSLFVVTNLPYVVDEFIRQKILTDAWCDSTFCDTVEVPFLFLWLFTKYFFLLTSLTQNLHYTEQSPSEIKVT